ncbi:DUF2975 domain-containing protein [Nonlabens sp.]|uniref:DUF2975 domain-containing protein n=1 Tax=Nonlabens sp. TaxID=1888209 RepID=UPI003F69A72B
MKQKRYFDKFTIGYTMFFIVIAVLVLLGKFSKEILKRNNLITSTSLETPLSVIEITQNTAGIVIFMLIIYSVFCFYRFMKGSNNGKLFSSESYKLWKQISTVYIIIGGIAALLCILDFKYAGLIPIGGLLSSVSYSFSKIFKDSAKLQQENDLTI